MPALRRCGRMWEVAFGNGKEVQELVLGIALGGIHRGLARQDLATALEGVKPRGELVGGKGQRTGREKPYIPPRDASIGAAGGRSESERGSRVPCPISSFAATLSPTAATRERWARTEKAKVPCGLMGGGVEEEERQHVGGGGATFVLGLLFKCGAVEVDDNGRLSDRFGARHPNNALRRSRRAKEQSRGEPGPGGGTVLRLTQLARLQAGLDRIHANASPTGGGGDCLGGWHVGGRARAPTRRRVEPQPARVWACQRTQCLLARNLSCKYTKWILVIFVTSLPNQGMHWRRQRRCPCHRGGTCRDAHGYGDGAGLALHESR